MVPGAWSATKSFVQLINHGGGGHMLIGQWLQGQGSFEGFFSKMSGSSFSERKKKKNDENSTNFCQVSSQNTILGSLFYDKINWKF